MGASLEQQLEALLFFKNEPVTIKELTTFLEVDESIIRNTLKNLKQQLESRGICLMEKEKSVMLATAPEVSGVIEKVRKEELSRDIGKAGIETLSVILYKGPVARSEIDYIRGVNSTFILRNLLIRGLIERISNPKNQRSFLYKPTFELLSFLGISSIEELPKFKAVQQELEKFEADQRKEEQVSSQETAP